MSFWNALIPYSCRRRRRHCCCCNGHQSNSPCLSLADLNVCIFVRITCLCLGQRLSRFLSLVAHRTQFLVSLSISKWIWFIFFFLLTSLRERERENVVVSHSDSIDRAGGRIIDAMHCRTYVKWWKKKRGSDSIHFFLLLFNLRERKCHSFRPNMCLSGFRASTSTRTHQQIVSE